MDLNERFKTARKLAGISQLKLAEAVGCTRVAVTMWESGATKKIEGTLLVRAAKTLNVRPEWLALGEEPMRAFAEEEFVMVPRHEVAASLGYGMENVSEQVVDHLAFKHRWLVDSGLDRNHLALISAVGDSMTPTINDGDLLLIDKRISKIKDLKNGTIYVFRVDTHLYAKRIQRRMDGSILVMSDNKIYSDEVISADSLADIHFIGRVVWIGRTI
ncbi:MAG: helix-turn-helix transcriptional regulator [Magnetococcales bacterium]|nr:helix-turn-helix transcriptional regulator [Magnetococcales bacterium]